MESKNVDQSNEEKIFINSFQRVSLTTLPPSPPPKHKSALWPPVFNNHAVCQYSEKINLERNHFTGRSGTKTT